jgi:protein tyrosine phosphatase (PTP) superfamily phosphohydrolase (DUF442 family)
MPKYQLFPIFVWCMSGSRAPVLFTVELGREHMRSQPVFLQQVTGPQDRSLVGQANEAIG